MELAPVYKEVKKLTHVGYEFLVDTRGSKHWRLNGTRHREDGPAVEWADGSQFWFLNDKSHRLDGPARLWASGSKQWFLNDIEVTEHDFNEVWNCPLDELPLYINTVELAPIMRWRLNNGA